MPGIQTSNIELGEALSDRLQRLADARQQSPEELMRTAIERYVGYEEDRDQFTRDALEAWAEYQATGLHVTGEEASDWLRELAAGKNVEHPKLHK